MARRIRRAVLAALLAGTVVAEVGCSSKSDSTPNPDMGTPNIPPGRKAGEGAGPKDVKK